MEQIMDDRDLLEFAAKAAGHCVRYSKNKAFGIDKEGYWTRWSPLYDDGDALRLAADLDFCITINKRIGVVQVLPRDGPTLLVKESTTDDVCQATRRAIVRAAAEIGRATNGS